MLCDGQLARMGNGQGEQGAATSGLTLTFCRFCLRSEGKAAKRSDKVPGDKVPGLNTGHLPEVILSTPCFPGCREYSPRGLEAAGSCVPLLQSPGLSSSTSPQTLQGTSRLSCSHLLSLPLGQMISFPEVHGKRTEANRGVATDGLCSLS